MTEKEISNVFYPMNENPLKMYLNKIMIKNNGISVNEWIGIWNQLAADNYKLAYKSYQYIGFESSLSDTF